MIFKEESPRGKSEQIGNGHDSDGVNASLGRTELDDAIGTAGRRRTTTKTTARPQRVTAALGRGESVIVVGHDLTMDRWIKILQIALSKAKRAQNYGLELDSFVKMLAELARG